MIRSPTCDQLRVIVYDQIEVLRVGLSKVTQTNIVPLIIYISKEESPVKVKLRNYSPEQQR